MKNLEIKSSIHELVDQIENERFLNVLYQLLKTQSGENTGKLWSALSSHQQEEVMKAFEESEAPYHLISKEKVFKKD